MSTPLVDSTVAAPLKPAQIKVQDAALAVQPALNTDQPDFAQMLVQVSRTSRLAGSPQTNTQPSALPTSHPEETDDPQVMHQEPDTQGRKVPLLTPRSEKHILPKDQLADTGTGKEDRTDVAPIEPTTTDSPPQSRPLHEPERVETLPPKFNKPLPVGDQADLQKAPLDYRSTAPVPATKPAPAEQPAASNPLLTKATHSASSNPLPPQEAIQQTLLSNPSMTVPKGFKPDVVHPENTRTTPLVRPPEAAPDAPIPTAATPAPPKESHAVADVRAKGRSLLTAQPIKLNHSEAEAPQGMLPVARPQSAALPQPAARLQPEPPVNILVKTPVARVSNEAASAPPARPIGEGMPAYANSSERMQPLLVPPKQAELLEPNARSPATVISHAAPKGPALRSGNPEPATAAPATTPVDQGRLLQKEVLATPNANSSSTNASQSSSPQLFTLVATKEPPSPVSTTALPLQPSTASIAAIPGGAAPTPHAIKPKAAGQSDLTPAQSTPIRMANPAPVATQAKPTLQPVDRSLKVDPAFTLLVPSSEGVDMLHWDPARASPTSAAQPVRGDLTPHIARQLVEVLPQATHRPVEIALSPQELGRVRMSIKTDDGAVTVNILAERADTLDLMRRNIEQLGQSFRNMGYDQITFSFGQGMDSDGQGEGADQGEPQAADLNANSTEDTPAPSDLNGPALRVQTTGIDIRL